MDGFTLSDKQQLLMYIIATSPRTGGHFLCDLLASTQICGHPSEYLLLQTEHKWRTLLRCRTRQEYLDFYLKKGWSTNGVFGAKLTWRQFCEFTSELGGGPSLNNQERVSVLGVNLAKGDFPAK